MSEIIHIAALDGSGTLPAYANGPADAEAAIIVIQEIFGVNPGIRMMVDHWAALGYRSVAPELYWRLAPGASFDPDVPEQFQQAYGIYQKFDMTAAVGDIEATIRALRASGARKIGLVGYCLGGSLAYLSACRTDIDASVGYYGVGYHKMLGEAHAIANPLMMHIATQDGFVPAENQAEIHAALDPHPRVTLHDYAADHAFARAVGASRVPDMAELADARTMMFFQQNLA